MLIGGIIRQGGIIRGIIRQSIVEVVLIDGLCIQRLSDSRVDEIYFYIDVNIKLQLQQWKFLSMYEMFSELLYNFINQTCKVSKSLNS